jgi:hypothetical protein
MAANDNAVVYHCPTSYNNQSNKKHLDDTKGFNVMGTGTRTMRMV